VTQHAALQPDLQALADNAKPRSSQARKPRVPTAVAATDPAASVATTDPATPEAIAKPAKKPNLPGPLLRGLRARTAASYGHAFVWYGRQAKRRSTLRACTLPVDEVPYILGHLMWVPSETERATVIWTAIPDCELPGLFERGGCTEGFRLYQAPAGDLAAMECPNNQLHRFYRPIATYMGPEGAVPSGRGLRII